MNRGPTKVSKLIKKLKNITVANPLLVALSACDKRWFGFLLILQMQFGVGRAGYRCVLFGENDWRNPGAPPEPCGAIGGPLVGPPPTDQTETL
jgi:hypothetical protein